jgi:hypothetical protein
LWKLVKFLIVKNNCYKLCDEIDQTTSFYDDWCSSNWIKKNYLRMFNIIFGILLLVHFAPDYLTRYLSIIFVQSSFNLNLTSKITPTIYTIWKIFLFLIRYYFVLFVYTMATTAYEPNESVPDVPLAFVSNSHLDELTNKIRSRPVPWDVSF